MKRKIVVDYGTVKKLMARSGASRRTVSNALNYRSESELERKIRFVAVRDFNGVVIER